MVSGSCQISVDLLLLESHLCWSEVVLGRCAALRLRSVGRAGGEVARLHCGRRGALVPGTTSAQTRTSWFIQTNKLRGFNPQSLSGCSENSFHLVCSGHYSSIRPQRDQFQLDCCPERCMRVCARTLRTGIDGSVSVIDKQSV